VSRELCFRDDLINSAADDSCTVMRQQRWSVHYSGHIIRIPFTSISVDYNRGSI
jgi:hypothetical protein